MFLCAELFDSVWITLIGIHIIIMVVLPYLFLRFLRCLNVSHIIGSTLTKPSTFMGTEDETTCMDSLLASFGLV